MLGIPRNDGNTSFQGNHEEGAGQIVCGNAADAAMGEFVDQGIVLRIRAEQFRGKGDEDGLSFQIPQGNQRFGQKRVGRAKHYVGAVIVDVALLDVVAEVLVVAWRNQDIVVI